MPGNNEEWPAPWEGRDQSGDQAASEIYVNNIALGLRATLDAAGGSMTVLPVTRGRRMAEFDRLHLAVLDAVQNGGLT
jgi:hypothetical protein